MSRPSLGSPSRLQALSAALLLVGIWGTTWAAIRINLEGFPPITGMGIRFAIAGVLLILAARAFKAPLLPRNSTERGLFWCQTIFTFCIAYGVVYWAEQWVPSGLMSVIFSTFPLFVAIEARFLLPDEKMSKFGWLGVLIGFSGVATIFSEDFEQIAGPQMATAATVALLSPLSSSIGNVIVKRWGGGIHSLSLNAVPMLTTGILLTILGKTVIEPGRAITLAPAPVIALLYLAVFGSAVAFGIYFWLLQHMPATQLSLITYAIPVVAVAVGTLLLDEPFTMRMVLGTALVIVGVGCTMRSS